MSYLRWLGLLLVTSLAATSFAADIQVTCEPALRVYLDGKLVGTSSSRDDGLFLADVPAGAHTVRVEKDGFVAQGFQVEVRELPIEVKAGEFSPIPVIPDGRATAVAKVQQAVGNLLVTSAPQNCIVEIDGNPQTKSVPLLHIEGLAAGEHQISFSKPGYERISGVVEIQPGAEVTVRGDLIAGKAETVHEGKGSLRVISMPEHCTVQFFGMTREKTRAKLNISHIPAGEHRIVVVWKKRELTSDLVIRNGQRAVVTVSFAKGEEPFVVSYEPE